MITRRVAKNAIRLIWSFVVILAALAPTWLCLFADHAMKPESFWQKILLGGAGIYFLGDTQIAIFPCLIVVLFMIWEG